MPSPTRTASARSRRWRQAFYRPNGIAFKNGTLYIAELSKVSKVDKVEDNLDSSPKPTMIYDNLPKDEAHGWKFIAIGPDNKLYVPVGQPGNNVLHSDAHGLIRRINLDGSGAEVIARGVRNTVGFDWNPETKQLYFTDNGRDWMSEDMPEDELNRVTKVGEHFGAPYCLQGNLVDPEFGWGKSCATTRRRSACWARIRPRWACGSTPATCSRRPTRTPSSSRGTARGTGPRKSAAMSSSSS